MLLTFYVSERPDLDVKSEQEDAMHEESIGLAHCPSQEDD